MKWDLAVTKAMLERLGSRVMVAKTDKVLTHMTETFDGQIDLAPLDIKLPDMEGGSCILTYHGSPPGP